MLTVTKESKNGVTQVSLAGIIDETTDLNKQIGTLQGRVDVVCRDVVGINSLGVKCWIEYFSKSLATKKVQISFLQCSSVIIEQLNCITNFSCGATVTSILAPFFCEKCKKEVRGAVKTDDLRKVGFKLPPIKCPTCKGDAFFDDIVEEYFAFLIRQNPASAS